MDGRMDGRRNNQMFGQLVYVFGERPFVYIICETYIYIYIYMCVCVCVCARAHFFHILYFTYTRKEFSGLVYLSLNIMPHKIFRFFFTKPLSGQ